MGYLSGGTSVEANRWFPNVRLKFDAEAAVRASGVPFTIFRPSWFMESTSRLVRDGQAASWGRRCRRCAGSPRRTTRAWWRRRTRNPRRPGRALSIWGPEAKTLEQVITHYCRVAAPGTKVMKVPFFMASVMAFVTGNKELKAFVPFMRFTAEHPEPGNPEEANRLLGAPTITFEQWCQARAVTA